jgi:CRISPR type III-A-associated protein Csm2
MEENQENPTPVESTAPEESPAPAVEPAPVVTESVISEDKPLVIGSAVPPKPEQRPREREERGPRGDRGDRGPRPERGDRGPRPERGQERGGGRPDQKGGGRPQGGGHHREGGREGGRPGGHGGGDRRGFEPMADIDIEKLISDSLYLDNQAHAVVARMRDMDSGTKTQLRRFFNAVRRAVRTPESDRQHQFVMLRARLAYTIARHSLRSLDGLERLLLQVTRKNDAKGYERFKDLFEAIVAYNE